MKFLSFLKPKVIHRTKIVQVSAASSQPVTAGYGSSGYYDALKQSDHRTPLATYGSGGSVSGYHRQALAILSRHLYDNFALCSYAVDQIVRYSVPVIPQAATANPQWNLKSEKLFRRWMKRADFTGRFSYEWLQRIACRAMYTDADIGAAMTLESGIPQLQLIEGWRIGDDGKTKNVDGALLDSAGRISGYLVDHGDKKFKPVASNMMRLIYDPERYSSYRGIPAIRRGSNDLRDAQDIKGFEKLAMKIASALPAYINGQMLEENVWANNAPSDDETAPGDGPATGETATPQQKKTSKLDLFGGDVPVIDGEIKQLQNNRQGGNVTEFIAELAGHFVAGLGIPPAFFLDEKLTGPNQRSVNGKAQRKFDEVIAVMADFAEWTWVRVTAHHIATGELEAEEGWDECGFQVPPKLSIDAGREMAQEREDVDKCLMTRQEHYGNRSRDWQRETDQTFAEDDYIIGKCQEQATRTGVDLKLILARRGFVDKKAASTPEKETPQPTGQE